MFSFEEKSADLSGIAHADNSDIGDDHPHSPKAVSTGALSERSNPKSYSILNNMVRSESFETWNGTKP